MYYGNTESYEKMELLSIFGIYTLPLKVNLTKTPQIDLKGKSVLWANAEDFNFVVSGPGVSANNTTHKITGNSIGTVNVTATHKVTGRVTTFKAVVCQYEATVNNYYDKGYIVANESDVQKCKEKLNEYMLNVAGKFAELFGLYINYSTPQYFESQLDKCKGTVTEDNKDTLCEHSNNDALLEDISGYVSGSDTVTNVYWTNHKVIYTNEYGVEFENRSVSSGYYILMLDTIDFMRPLTLFHELCHQYEVKDHYHEDDETGENEVCSNQAYGCSECAIVEKRSSECIMCDGTRSLGTVPLMCEDCMEDVRLHLEDHH